MISRLIVSPRRRAACLATLLLASTAIVPFAAEWASPVNAATSPAATATQLPGSFADLVERVSPAVVSIVTTQPASAMTAEAPELPELPPNSPFAPFFREFRQFGGPQMPEHRAPRHDAMSLGSGFIIDPSGYVVTNNHVIDGGTGIEVVMADGTRLDAKLIGRDDKVDLALLKVETDKDLPYLNFGDSDNVRVGDWTIAVGNPFGLGGTVTAGIVSARGRDIHSGPYDDYLQLDASINRGNSGGPTFDANGTVIGINTAIYSPNGGNVGIGFAIPANLAQPIIAELKDQGFVSRGWLGVQIQPVTPEIAQSLGLDKPEGALVAQVTPDSPAAAAGLEVGDIVTAFGGEPIVAVRDLSRIVAAADISQEQSIDIWRHGSHEELEAKLRTAPATQDVAAAEPEAVPNRVLGLDLASLNDKTRQEAGVPEDVNGVLVVGVSEDVDGGVQPGDVILSVDNKPVTTPAEVAERVKAASEEKHDAVLVLINRQGSQHFTTLDVRHA